MSKELFPVIEITEEAFSTYSRTQFPRSRERALCRAIEQRCIIAGQLPESAFLLLNCNREKVRYLPGDSALTSQRPELRCWEDTSLGAPFGSTILQQGAQVRNALNPALLANSIVNIIDPYLISGSGPAHADGLKQLIELSKLKAITAITKLDKIEHLSTISKWLKDNIDHNCELKVSLQQKHNLHDRFMGLINTTTHTDWQALSIGYGLTALTDAKKRRTCLARITSEHFLNTWKEAEKRCTWQILRSSDVPPSSSQWKFKKNCHDMAIYQRKK